MRLVRGALSTAVLIDIHSSLVRERQRGKLEFREWRLLLKALQLENSRGRTGATSHSQVRCFSFEAVLRQVS